jgi:hypothetical protein
MKNKESVYAKKLYDERDKLVKSLWSVLDDISYVIKLTNEDMDLWIKVTGHSAIQNQLDKEVKK